MRKAALAITLLAAVGCVDPQDRRPGLWLSGEVVAGPVEDWSFSDDFGEIFLEVKTPYLLAHSVTILCASLDGKLYVGARNPDEKRWVSYLESDPDVRLKIGERVYEARLAAVEDPQQREALYRAYGAKYDRAPQPAEERPEIRYFLVENRG